MNPRILHKIQITSEAQAAFEAVLERTGMTKVAVASRLVEWFATLPQPLQIDIMRRMWDDPAGAHPDIARAVLDSLDGPASE